MSATAAFLEFELKGMFINEKGKEIKKHELLNLATIQGVSTQGGDTLIRLVGGGQVKVVGSYAEVRSRIQQALSQ